MFFLIVMFLFVMPVYTESPLKDVSSIVPLVLETRLREQQQIGNTNTVRIMLHILDMMRRIPAEGEKFNIGIYESKLRVQLRKYYDESSRLVKGFMERPVNPNEKVSVIEMVLFHIEKSPYMVMFYGTTREKRLLREAIASYRKVITSPNTVWEERLAALEEVRKRYQDIKVMKEVMMRLPKLDFSLEQGKRAREDAQEIAHIALGRIKKIVGKSVDSKELVGEIEKYLLLEATDASIAEGHMKKILQLWERYRTPRIA